MSAAYEFKAKLWRHEGAAAWHFITLPADISVQIKTLAGRAMNAFGSLRINATIAKQAWKTSLFLDTKRGAFLLPVKADIRRKARVGDGDEIAVKIELEL